MNMVLFWLIATAVFLVFEVVTTALVSLWFAVGSLAALAAAALAAPLWVQVLVFVLVSALCFALIYPRIKSSIAKHHQATNADKVIGQVCTVTQKIDNLAGTGTVAVDGKTWTARTLDGQILLPGELVQIQRIEGVKLMVTPAQERITT
jgi:membrane protein implicated in regulation of membrane protease activity